MNGSTILLYNFWQNTNHSTYRSSCIINQAYDTSGVNEPIKWTRYSRHSLMNAKWTVRLLTVYQILIVNYNDIAVIRLANVIRAKSCWWIEIKLIERLLFISRWLRESRAICAIAKGLIERYRFSTFNDAAYHENLARIHSISSPHMIMYYPMKTTKFPIIR